MIEKLIQDFWRRRPDLTGILPRERVVSGPSQVPVYPCLVVSCPQRQVWLRTNQSRRWERAELRLELFDATLEGAETLMERLVPLLDHARIDLPDGDGAAILQWMEQKNERHERGWSVRSVFRVIVGPF